MGRVGDAGGDWATALHDPGEGAAGPGPAHRAGARGGAPRPPALPPPVDDGPPMLMAAEPARDPAQQWAGGALAEPADGLGERLNQDRTEAKSHLGVTLTVPDTARGACAPHHAGCGGAP